MLDLFSKLDLSQMADSTFPSCWEKSKIKLVFLCIIKNCENKVNMQEAFPNGCIHGVWPNEVRET